MKFIYVVPVTLIIAVIIYYLNYSSADMEQTKSGESIVVLSDNLKIKTDTTITQETSTQKPRHTPNTKQSHCSIITPNYKVALVEQFNLLKSKGLTDSEIESAALEAGLASSELRSITMQNQADFQEVPVVSMSEIFTLQNNVRAKSEDKTMRQLLRNFTVDAIVSAVNEGEINVNTQYMGTSFFSAILRKHHAALTPEDIQNLMDVGYTSTLYDLQLATRNNLSTDVIEALQFSFLGDKNVVWLEEGMYKTLTDLSILQLNQALFNYWTSAGVMPANNGNITPFDMLPVPTGESEITRASQIVESLLDLNFIPKNNSVIKQLNAWLPQNLVEWLNQSLVVYSSEMQNNINELSQLFACLDADEKVVINVKPEFNSIVEAQDYHQSIRDKQAQQRQELNRNTSPETLSNREAYRIVRKNIYHLAKQEQWGEIFKQTEIVDDVSTKRRLRAALLAALRKAPLWVIIELFERGAIIYDNSRTLRYVINAKRDDVLRYGLNVSIFTVNTSLRGSINGLYYAVSKEKSYPMVRTFLEYGAPFKLLQNDKDIIHLTLEYYVKKKPRKIGYLTTAQALLQNGVTVTSQYKHFIRDMSKLYPEHYQKIVQNFPNLIVK